MEGAGSAPDDVLDFGHHVLPLLAGSMLGYHVQPYFLKDIGTPHAYQGALAQWPQKKEALAKNN